MATTVIQERLDEDESFPIRPYTSSTMQQTAQEINYTKIISSRPLLRMQFIRKRKEFCQPYKFTQNDSQKSLQFKPAFPDPVADKQTKVLEIGLQGSNPYTSSGAQTAWKRKVNKCMQINDEAIYLPVEDDNPELLKFLQTVYPDIQQALQSNQTIDVFQDDFDVLPKNEGNKENSQISNSIKQTKNLFYLNCKGKKVSCIQFQPWIQGKSSNHIIAESFVENLNFDDRVILSMKSYKSCILFWNFEDLHAIDPVLILSSPLEILTFEFNPKDPNIIIAGAINGQIVMWDIHSIVLSGQIKKQSRSDKNEVREVQPLIMSALQDPSSIVPFSEQVKKTVPSHRQPVVCIKWFPSGLQLEMKKNCYQLATNPSPDINQFASISSDGQVLIWDRRFQDNQKKPVVDVANFVWKAGYGLPMIRSEGRSALGGAQITFKKNQKTTTFIATSDQGELIGYDWSAFSTNQNNTKNQPITNYWGQQRSFRPPVALQLCPSNQDIILTVHDFHFTIWKMDFQTPIFSSMISKGAFHTCGCWSPTRAGVIFIGRSDGFLDIWDFIDQSHKCTIQYPVTSIGLSSIKFHNNLDHVLAVGDQQGTLHILELPFTLVRKIGDEDRTMVQFWQREIERVTYFGKRFVIRYEQAQKQKALRDLDDKGGNKQDKRENEDEEDELINKEYLQFSQAYLAEHIYKTAEKKIETKASKK